MIVLLCNEVRPVGPSLDRGLAARGRSGSSTCAASAGAGAQDDRVDPGGIDDDLLGLLGLGQTLDVPVVQG